MKHTLYQKGFVNPLMVRKAKSHDFTGTIVDGTVETDLGKLHFHDTCPYENNTLVSIGFSNNYYCQSVKEIEQERDAREKRKLDTLERQKAESIKHSKDCTTFNNTLNIPFKWRAGFKPTLSGLSQNSWGNGMNKATVIHIQVMEDFKQGRLSRTAGDFLCTKDLGKQWLSDAEKRLTDANGDYYYPKITCKACLRKITNLTKTKWKNEHE